MARIEIVHLHTRTPDEARRIIDGIAAAVPVVYGGRPVRRRENDYYIDVDNVSSGRLATEHLIASGRRRIGTIAGPLTMSASLDRLEGFREALQAAGLEPGPVEEGDFTVDSGAAAVRRMIDSGEPFDALFVASDLMARGAITVLAQAGLTVPDDIAVIGFDDSPVALGSTPQLTTMRQPSFAQGEAMADVLLTLLAGGQPEHATILDTELVVRESA